MTGETARLVREIKARCRAVTSLVGRYETVYRLQLMPFEGRGRFFFLAPDKCRAESTGGSSPIISVRNGTRVERRLPARNEIWKYDLKDLPQRLPINYAIADFWDPFFLVEEDAITYEGAIDLDNVSTHRFSARGKNWEGPGTLDTRKGFSISYQPQNLSIRFQLYVSAETGVLRRLIGTGEEGRTLLQADYMVDGINLALEESLFLLEESNAAFKTIDITDVMLSGMNPDSADAPPSKN